MFCSNVALNGWEVPLEVIVASVGQILYTKIILIIVKNFDIELSYFVIYYWRFPSDLTLPSCKAEIFVQRL